MSVTGYTQAGADAQFATQAALALKATASSLATVATSGSYADLTNVPAAFSGSYTDLTNKPTLFSGSYTDLTNKPTIPAAQVQTDWNASTGLGQILNKPTLGTAAAQNTTAFATAAQGAKADTAAQATDLATVATSGSANDLTQLAAASLTAFTALMVPVAYNTTTSSWPTLNAWLSTQANVGWHFIGGTETTPPPTVSGPAIWDRPTT